MTSSPAKTIALVERRQQPVQVLALEAGEIEIEAGGVERVQLGGEQLVIPAGQLGQAVVRDPVARGPAPASGATSE